MFFLRFHFKVLPFLSSFISFHMLSDISAIFTPISCSESWEEGHTRLFTSIYFLLLLTMNVFLNAQLFVLHWLHFMSVCRCFMFHWWTWILNQSPSTMFETPHYSWNDIYDINDSGQMFLSPLTLFLSSCCPVVLNGVSKRTEVSIHAAR